MNPARLVCQLAEDAGQPRHQRVDDHLPSQPFGLQHRLPGRVDCSGGQGLTPGGCRKGVCQPPWPWPDYLWAGEREKCGGKTVLSAGVRRYGH